MSWTPVSPYRFAPIFSFLSYLDPLSILSPLPLFFHLRSLVPMVPFHIPTVDYYFTFGYAHCLCAARPFFVIPLLSPTHFYCYARYDYLSFALPRAASLFISVGTTHMAFDLVRLSTYCRVYKTARSHCISSA